MKILVFLLISLTAFAQKDSVKVDKKVVKVGSDYYLQTRTVSFQYQAIDVQFLEQIEQIDMEKQSKIDENVKLEVQRKNLVNLVKDAQQLGFVPKPNNSIEDSTYRRILRKISKIQ